MPVTSESRSWSIPDASCAEASLSSSVCRSSGSDSSFTGSPESISSSASGISVSSDEAGSFSCVRSPAFGSSSSSFSCDSISSVSLSAGSLISSSEPERSDSSANTETDGTLKHMTILNNTVRIFFITHSPLPQNETEP